VSEIIHNGSSSGAWTLTHDPHQEFQELCALSTTGELTAEEWARLSEHLIGCDACREAQRQYDRVVAAAIPALAAESGADEDVENAPGSWSIEEAENTLMESLRSEPVPSRIRSISPSLSPLWRHARRYAVAAMILVACGLAGYRIGIHQGHRTDASVAPAASPGPSTPSRSDRSGAAALPSEEKRSSPADDQGAALRSQARQNQQELAKLKDQLSQVENELAERNANLNRSVEDRSELSRQLAQAQANSQSLEARLSIIGNQSAQDTLQSLALKTQVNDLKAEIEDKDKVIAEERELLDRDRDVRNLISARNLYIAEIYDVAQTGDTQKPFGRVFYTKDKSLIFYGYDLDQQPGVKKAAAFQAWGGRGADRQHAVSLGLLYKDDANQKRWVLKFNDAKTISQIDAVFVTVEPEGGSAKPSGKPLLFTYLRLDPNHP
jgi:hypothetical protein